MGSLATYLAMGGYAGFVWPAWGLAAVVMCALLVVSRRSLKGKQDELATLQDGEPGRRGRLWDGQDR
jgi:heme exporter protein D